MYAVLVRRLFLLILAVVIVVIGPRWAVAGGGPMNVMVLFNDGDLEAAAVAEHYRQRRGLAHSHVCALPSADPARRSLDFGAYEAEILEPTERCLGALPHPELIDYLVLVRGLPYRVELGEGAFTTSLSAMLQVMRARDESGVELAGQPQQSGGGGFGASIENPHFLPSGAVGGDYLVSNPFSGWYGAAPRIVRSEQLPRSFRSEDAEPGNPWDFVGNLFIVTRLDGFDYQDAWDLVDRGVEAEGVVPAGTLLCMEAADQARGARDPECEFATRYLSAAGFEAEYLAPFDGDLAGRELAAYFTGAADARGAIDGNVFAPGAIACNLTSFGAAPSNFYCDGDACPGVENQTSIARFVRAGATGVHGTANEPLNNSFPNAGALLLYTLGYNLGESFFFNQRFLYWQNIILGDPLTTPWVHRPLVSIDAGDQLPLGSELVVSAEGPSGIAKIRLYVNGELVSELRRDILRWEPSGVVGDELQILAVAYSANVAAFRPGWPVEEVLARPDVQGWTRATLTLGEAVLLDEEPPGCACGSGREQAPLVGLGLLTLYFALRGRERLVV